MSEQHTPGPWVEFASTGATVAIMPAMRDGDICQFAEPYPSRADARLIAAAPDLLQAARKAVGLLIAHNDSGNILDELERAIAKADGPVANPRLQTLPLTAEDSWANAVFAVTRGLNMFRACVLSTGFEADRRDADLMLKARCNRESLNFAAGIQCGPRWLGPMWLQTGPCAGALTC